MDRCRHVRRRGSAFDSEIWADSALLDQVYKRPANVYQSMTVHLQSPEVFQQFKDSLTSDPRLNLSVDRELDYTKSSPRPLPR